jgi:hypothetical protein
MARTERVSNLFGGDFCVNLRGGYRCMAEHVLKPANVPAVLQDDGCKGVPYRVGRNPFLKANRFRGITHDLPGGLTRKAPAEMVQKERR